MVWFVPSCRDTHPRDPPPLRLVGVVQQCAWVAEHLGRQLGRQVLYGHAMVAVSAEYLWRLVHERRLRHAWHLEASSHVMVHGGSGRMVLVRLEGLARGEAQSRGESRRVGSCRFVCRVWSLERVKERPLRLRLRLRAGGCKCRFLGPGLDLHIVGLSAGLSALDLLQLPSGGRKKRRRPAAGQWILVADSRPWRPQLSPAVLERASIRLARAENAKPSWEASSKQHWRGL